MFERIEETPLRRSDAGLVPDGDGWFIVNVAESRGMRSERFGAACVFEGASRFREFGVNVRVLQPGQPNALYHREDAQEDFLVLRGECVAIVEDQERPMRAGDFLHAPNGTAHVLVGAGDGPCVILMIGTRKEPETLSYPVSATAGRYGASVEQETSDEQVAYAGTARPEPTAIGMPW